MRWRSPQEIKFRLNQEFRNLALLLKPPSLPAGNFSAPLPDTGSVVDRLRGTRTEEAIAGWAELVLAHRFPLLGLDVDTGPEIRWRRDYQSGKETAAVYFRRIPYLDAARAGDHKVIWELNRHQHLVLLAQAHRITGRAEFLREIERQLRDWEGENPFQRGINWCSALEVAFRALSWMWVYHLCGDRMDSTELLKGLYRHGLHLEANLSVYFSPNTHLLGEAVALHALGRMFRGAPGAETWEPLGAQITAEQMERQVHEDGSHFEQSSYYHVYALDMFLFHAALAPPAESYRIKLTRMAEYLEALLGPNRSLPAIGDDDGGRFFYPYGPRDRFGRATLATCGVLLDRPEWILDPDDLNEQAAWWLGAQALREPGARSTGASRWFPGAGTAVMVAGDVHAVVDAGPFGPFRSGHSHADTLGMVVRSAGQDLLVDPGTFTYVGDSRWRDAFRGSAAHNTIRLQGADQADAAGPFGWRNPPRTEMKQWCSTAEADYLDAECRYRGFRHRRRVLFVKPELMFILDEVQGPPSGWEAEQFWHPSRPVEMLTASCFRIGNAAMLVLALAGGAADLSEGGEFGWRSPVFGVKEPAPVIVVRRRGTTTLHFGAVLAFSSPSSTASLAMTAGVEGIELALAGALQARFTFPESGIPRRES